MTAASASHRLLNFVQSALLLGLIAWSAVTAIAGPENGLLMALAMGGGLPFAPGLPRRQLLSTYQAQRLTGRDAPVSSRPWPNSHAGPGCSAHPHGAGPTRPFAHARVRCRPRRSRFDRRSGGARARARQARTPGRSVQGGDPSARPPHSGAQDASPDRKPNPPSPGVGHGAHEPDPRPCRLPDRNDTARRDTASVPSPWALLAGLQGSWIAQENGDLSEGRSSREGWISGPSTPPSSFSTC